MHFMHIPGNLLFSIDYFPFLNHKKFSSAPFQVIRYCFSVYKLFTALRMHQISPQITTLRHVSNIPFPRKNLLRISSEIFLFCWSYVIFVSVHCTAIINVFREFFWKRPKNGTFCHVQSYMGLLKLSCIIQQQIMAVSVRPDHFIILPLKPLVQTPRS